LHRAINGLQGGLMHAGHARPAVSVTHGLSHVGTALRQLMQATHVGKIVAKAKSQARS